MEDNRRPLHIAICSSPIFDAGNAHTLILHRDIPEVNGSSLAPMENQVNVKEEFCSSSHSLAPVNDNDFGTGIKVRALQQHMVASGSTINNQGTAQRRLRLQMKLQGSVGQDQNLSPSGERCEGKPRVAEVGF